MNCPYCNKRIDAFTGLQELRKFQRHLNCCRKNPANVVFKARGEDGRTHTVLSAAGATMNDALNIRHKSGQ